MSAKNKQNTLREALYTPPALLSSDGASVDGLSRGPPQMTSIGQIGTPAQNQGAWVRNAHRDLI